MRVLLATDASNDARSAVEWLRQFRMRRPARVLVLSVAPAPRSPLDANAMAVWRATGPERGRHATSMYEFSLPHTFGTARAFGSFHQSRPSTRNLYS